MPISIPLALLIGGLASAGASAASAIAGSRAAGKAADTQTAAADKAAELAYKAGQEALAFQKQVYSDALLQQAPWYNVGKSSLFRLSDLVGLPRAQTRMPLVPGAQAPTGYFKAGELNDIATKYFRATRGLPGLAPPTPQTPANAPPTGGEEYDPAGQMLL